jgi:hypothetical protein
MSKQQIKNMNELAGNLNEYTVPNDARVIIVDGIRVSREFFSMLNDDYNEGREFILKKSAPKNNGLPIIEAYYYKAGFEPKNRSNNVAINRQ